MDVPQTLRTLKALMSGSQEMLAHRLGVSQATISRWIAGSDIPSGRNLQAIQKLATIYELSGPAVSDARQPLRLMGRTGGGEMVDPEFEQPPTDGFEQIDVDLDLPADAIAFEVTGASMWPRWRAGDLIVVRERTVDPDSLIGSDVAVLAWNGENWRRYIKRLAIGPKRGQYNLESISAREETIVGVKLRWASPILMTLHPAFRRHGSGAPA